MENDLKHELQNILRGTGEVGPGNLIQAAAGYLRKSAEAGEMVAGSKQDKLEEATRLINFSKENNLWIEEINLKNYISEGAEQKVFLNPPLNVFKLTDAIYYENWTDYLQSLMLLSETKFLGWRNCVSDGSGYPAPAAAGRSRSGRSDPRNQAAGLGRDTPK